MANPTQSFVEEIMLDILTTTFNDDPDNWDHLPMFGLIVGEEGTNLEQVLILPIPQLIWSKVSSPIDLLDSMTGMLRERPETNPFIGPLDADNKRVIGFMSVNEAWGLSTDTVEDAEVIRARLEMGERIADMADATETRVIIITGMDGGRWVIDHKRGEALPTRADIMHHPGELDGGRMADLHVEFLSLVTAK